MSPQPAAAAAAAAAANQILHRTRGQAMLLKQKAGRIPNQEHSNLARPKPKSFYFCVEKKQDKQTNSALATFIIESILHSSSRRWENSHKTESQNASRLKLFFASKYTHKNNNNASSS